MVRMTLKPVTAIRPGTFCKTSAEFSMKPQMIYDLRNPKKVRLTRLRSTIEDNRSVLA